MQEKDEGMRKPLSDLSSRLFDILIIGAGINGCATARQLAADGYDVLLVDKGDFGGRSTARSGRVLHCGLQLLAPRSSVWEYLRRPEELIERIGMARRTALDYAELLGALGPRLRPMHVAVPIYRGGGYSGWQVDLGAWLIRCFCGGRNAFCYRRWKRPGGAPHALAEMFANREALGSVVSFVDQRFEWPERIAIDAALDAEEMGAFIRNYTNVGSLVRRADNVWQAELTNVPDDGQKITAQARLVLDLAGVWVDEVIGRVGGAGTIEKKIVCVKGVYVLVRLADKYRGAGVAGHNSIGEPITCLPWGDLHYIGPTETLFTRGPEELRPEDEDVRFLVQEINRLLPGIGVGEDDIVLAWAGLRPITAAPGLPKGKRLPFNVLHDLADEGLEGMMTLSWGIIVHHRSTARRIAAAVAAKIPPSRPSNAFAWLPRQFPARASPLLQPGYPTTLADLSFCIDHEHARDLVGVLFSRTGIAWTAGLTRPTLKLAAKTIGDSLGWSREETATQIHMFIEYMKIHHRYKMLE